MELYSDEEGSIGAGIDDVAKSDAAFDGETDPHKAAKQVEQDVSRCRPFCILSWVRTAGTDVFRAPCVDGQIDAEDAGERGLLKADEPAGGYQQVRGRGEWRVREEPVRQEGIRLRGCKNSKDGNLDNIACLDRVPTLYIILPVQD